MADRYEILGKLGRGGLGAIYRARDTIMGREVAIKRLLPPEESTANEEASVESLKREAAALARFQHPNIVSVYSLEEDSDGPFVVTELIEGENLHNIVINGALPYEDFEAIAEQTLEPMIAAQKEGLMHRDIKPANIMLSELPSGKFIVKILDFGLAKFSMQPSTQTLDLKGTFLGSIDFIAPEQLELEPLDHRTDLYSLGCVLYYCLTQDSPFSGANAAETSQNHLNHVCTHLRELRPDVPGPVADWLMKMVERSPDDRPDNATVAMKEFLEAKKGISPVSVRLKQEKITDSIEVVQATDSIEAARGKERKRTGQPLKVQTGRVLRTGTIKRNEEASSAPVSQSAPSRLEPKTIAIAGGAALLLVILASLFLISGGDEENLPDDRLSVSGTGAAEAPEDLPDQPLGTPGKNLLPEMGTGSIPVTARVKEGLVANYKANIGAYHFDLKTLSRPGQKVAAWRNLIAPQSKSFLTYDWNDLEGRFLPTLQRVSGEDFPGLNGAFQALHFSNQDFLQTPDNVADFSGGLTTVIVGRFNATGEKVIRFIPQAYDGRLITLEASYSGNMVAQFRSVNDSSGIAIAEGKWPSGSPGVLAYRWNAGDGTQTIRGLFPDGARFDSGPKMVGKTDIPFARFSLGPRKFEEGRMTEPKTLIFEVSVYDRSLSDREITSMENQLAAKYFGLKSEPVNVTAVPKQASPAKGGQKQDSPEKIPVTEGLLNRFSATSKLFADEEGTVVAKPGDHVRLWQPIAGSANIFRQHKNKPEQTPTLMVEEPSPESGLKPGTRVLNFETETALLTPNLEGLENVDGFSLFVMGRLDPGGNGSLIKMDGAENRYNWTFLMPAPDGILSRMLKGDDTNERHMSKLALPEHRYSVISYIWNGKTGTRNLHVLTDQGETYEQVGEAGVQGAVSLGRLHMGTINYGGGSFISKGRIGEYILYKRALSDEERAKVEAFLAGKYFTEP